MYIATTMIIIIYYIPPKHNNNNMIRMSLVLNIWTNIYIYITCCHDSYTILKCLCRYIYVYYVLYTQFSLRVIDWQIGKKFQTIGIQKKTVPKTITRNACDCQFLIFIQCYNTLEHSDATRIYFWKGLFKLYFEG